MNYIKRLEKENALLKKTVLNLLTYVQLPKFDWPDEYVNKNDVLLRLREGCEGVDLYNYKEIPDE